MQFNISKTIEENKNLIDTKFIYNKTFKKFEEKNGENWIANSNALKKIISEPTGFSLLNGETDIYSSIISFSIDGTRILSITPTNEHFIFYVNGKEYIKTDVSQVQIEDIQGLHYIYFNENGVLESKNDFALTDIMKKYASVATVYWDYTNQKAIYIGDKRHSINSDAYQNYIDFINDKTVDYIDGTNIKFTNTLDGGINDKVDGDGSSNYHTSFAIESGKYRNYELINDSEQIEFNENIPILYKQTVTQEKNWIAMAFDTAMTKIVAISNDGEYRIMLSENNGETWSKIYLPFYSTWTDIIYAQNKFVAVASSGQYLIMTSTDGLTWTPIIVPQKNKWQSIAYGQVNGQNLFVVVGIDGTNRIMTSTNTLLWIVRDIPVYLPLKKIKYIPAYNQESAKFIAISEDDVLTLTNTQQDIQIYSKAVVSQNGITWTSLNISETKTWQTINYGNGRFISFSNTNKNRLINTSNINVWPTYELINSTFDNQNWTSTTYAFGHHFAVSSDGANRFIRSSTNGSSWESFSNIGANTWKKIEANQTNTIVAIANSGTTGRITYSSNNGNTWTVNSSQDAKVLEDIVYGLDKWVLIASEANSGRIIYTPDLLTFTSVTSRDTVRWKSISYGNSTYVAVGEEDVTWKIISPPEINDWTSVTFGNSLFVAVAKTGTNRVMTSSNGTSWTARAAAQANSWTSVTFGNNLFVAVSSDGTNRVMTSSNGTSWSTANAAEANQWTDVIYANNLFVAVSRDGTNRVMTSTNGTSWTARAAAQANSWTSVAYGNGNFVAVSSDGTNRVMTSSNGTSWSIANAAVIGNWQSIAYGGIFVAVALDGQIMNSIDGISWQDVTSNYSTPFANWINITYANGVFTIVGANNKVLISQDGIAWEVRDAPSVSGWSGTAYGNNTFVSVAVGVSGSDRIMSDFIDNNKIIWSSDGISWTTSTIAVSKNWKKIKYLNNGFFALNTVNEIYFSANGKDNWTKVSITSAESQNLQYTDFTTSGLILAFSTSINKIVVTGIDINATNFNTNARVLDVIDNLLLSDIETDNNGNLVVSTKQGKIITSTNNGLEWNIKDIINSTINKIKYFNNNFFLLSSSNLNRVVYCWGGFVNNINFVTESYFNHSIVDLIYLNNVYLFLINDGDKRIIIATEFIDISESTLSEYLYFKDTIKDIYNAWRRVDNFSNENIKSRCLIQNNKINYNKFNNNVYSLETCIDNKFYLYHVFMTNDKDNKYMIVVGNNEFSSKEEAKNNVLDEINKLSGLPFNDFLPLGTLIYEVNSNYLNSAKARIVNINGNNYYKLIKKDLVTTSYSINNTNNQIIKKENTNLLNNTDLINLYGNKILEYALNKLQDVVNRDIDNFITRKEITLSANGGTSNINTIFGAQITGSYEIFDKNNPDIGLFLFLKQNATSTNTNIDPDVNITSFSNLIIPSSTNASQIDALIGVYINNYFINFKNFSNNNINLVIYRKL